MSGRFAGRAFRMGGAGAARRCFVGVACVAALGLTGFASAGDDEAPSAGPPMNDEVSWRLTMQRVAKRPIGATCSGNAQCNTGLCLGQQCVCVIDADCGGARRCTTPAEGVPVCSP